MNADIKTTIRLTELRRADADVMLTWINDPHTVRFNAPYSPVHEIAHHEWFQAQCTDTSKLVFAIREIGGERLLGIVQLIDLHPVHRTAELTIRIGTEADRGRGIGTEAVVLVTRVAFNDRNLQRVWLRVFASNVRAIRAYERAGFQKEGVLKRACFIDGIWHDQLVMACLSDKT